MRVITSRSQVFDFGLTQVDQTEFDIQKYQALAFNSKQGLKLSDIVEERWLEWVDTVSKAPWLKNWHKSNFVRNKQDFTGATTPQGKPIDVENLSAALIAYTLYAEAVWGFGTSAWKVDDLKTEALSHNKTLKTIWNLQNMKYGCASRKYTIDDSIYRGIGLTIPCEFGELDRWLEPLWYVACTSSK